MSVEAKAARSVDHRFFTAVGVVLAAIVFVGFARTFYLKTYIIKQELPLALHVHGALMTLWYALFIVQARLIAAHRVALHRKLGVAGVFLAALVAAMGARVSIGLAQRDLMANPKSGGPIFLLGLQLFAIVLPFVILVALSVFYRRRPDYHKRFMALAMLSTLGPAVTRLPLGLSEGHNIPATIVIDVLLILACVVTDAIRNRRLHPAFGWGGGMLILSIFVVAPFAMSSAWMGFVRHWLL